MSGLDQQIEALRSLGTAELRQEWQHIWKEPAPRLGHDLLRRGIAWKLQEQAYVERLFLGTEPLNVLLESNCNAKI
jgi:hypothetical protein